MEFTDVEAVAVLEWANHASDDELTSVCGVGQTLADSLSTARPIRTRSFASATRASSTIR